MDYKKIAKYYNYLSLMFLNFILLFLLVNIILLIGFKIGDFISKDKNVVSEKYRQSSLEKVYPGLKEEEINEILGETWSRPFVYEPYTVFKERTFSGKYINVDENGFRITKNQGPWPIDEKKFNIFLFGGSTIFGYGLPDNQTIASYLSDHLSEIKLIKKDGIAVYNFGRGNYYSTQERILFEKLLVSGYKPDMAIFIDGVNDFYYNNEDKLIYSDLFEQLFGSTKQIIIFSYYRTLEKLPIAEAAQYIGDKIFKKEDSVYSEEKYNDSVIINRVINRYLENKKLIESAGNIYGVKTIFVWQPTPTYKYDLQYHLFKDGGFDQHTYSKYGYIEMAKIKNGKDFGNDFLWCADIQENEKKPLYVDKVHYTAEFSDKFANDITDLLVKRNLLK